MKTASITLFDRLISALTYFTFGGAGFIWLIICALTKKLPGQFVTYHIFQSIFGSILLFIVSWFFSIIFGFMSNIPILGAIVKQITLFFSTPLYFGYDLIQFTLCIFIFYLSLGALLGRYSYLPFISDVVLANVRR